MQGHRSVAVIAAITLIVLAITLPVDVPGAALLALLGLGIAVYAALGERAWRRAGIRTRRGSLAELIARHGSSATAEQRSGIVAMEEDLREATQRLRGASAGVAGTHSLDALPWLLVIGMPQSGKSSMLASSGMAFAFATASGGARGNRNARWWITAQGAWIDTAGTYVGGDATYPEWLSLLRNLATLRPAKPVDGIVVTVGADSLPSARPEDLDGAARKLRERIDEVLGYLGIDVPVYLMVTRCDLLPGFHEFFADLRDGERGQIWGRTWTMDDGAPVEERFAAGFDELQRTLSQRSIRRTTGREPPDARVACYQFPVWFSGLRANLLRFGATAFAASVFQERVSVRGIYFSSATDAYARTGASLAPTGTRGYFLRDWIQNVVLPDRESGGPSRSEVHRRRARSNVVASLLFAGAVLLSALPGWSWHEDVAAVRAFDEALTAAIAARPPVDLATLEQMRRTSETLRNWSGTAAPAWTGYGMAVPTDLSARASVAHARFVQRDALGPIADRLRRELALGRDRWGAAPVVPQDVRARLAVAHRTYLLLTAPRSPGDPQPGDAAQVEWLVPQVIREWEAMAPSNPVVQVARMQQVRAWAATFAADPSVGSVRDVALAQAIRSLVER